MSSVPSAGIRFDRVSYRVVASSSNQSIIDDLTLNIVAGETIVLLGRSGAGKTTTLKLINRLLEPTSGTVLVKNRSTADWDVIRLRRHIGYVIQEVGLFPHFTVAQNVGLVPSLEGWEPARTRERVREMLDLVGMDHDTFAPRYPDQLSGGQRQRVGVARALAADPSILLLDEPFGALDPITRSEIRREFRELRDRLGKTMVFVTHDVGEAFILADRIALMKDGRLLACVPPRELESLDIPEARKFMESRA
jgi:osmoprotectant transport system ATP-binding protein